MSEEILKALTQLFAIITKQDGGVTEAERQFVISFFQQELEQSAIEGYLNVYDTISGYATQGFHLEDEKNNIPTVKDSLKTLAICKKINKTLIQKQKVVVLIKLLELVGADKNFTAQRMEIINTVALVFNIPQEEFSLIQNFVITEHPDELNHPDILIAREARSLAAPLQKHIHAHVQGHLIFIRVSSVGMYFVKYVGGEAHNLNGFIMQPERIYLFTHGSTIKTQGGNALYYSDLVADFNNETFTTRLSFLARIEEFRFKNGAMGIRQVEISEGPGRLIGIMGASGAGKTTLLNLLAGLEKPEKGSITINGFDIFRDKKKLEGVIGYVSQDDLLIEELTVYQNLYYNAKLCFSNFTEQQIHGRVMTVLENLGLEQRKDLKVGSVLDKQISGGQRKRLNIALELIREPSVLFLDEPTSGLSSRDSENVIDLLKELSLKGTLIFTVIHQPSSDIYKMFDKMVIMDTGGYQVYYGNPVEAVTYFKKATNQVDSNRGQCELCGNVNPEQIFNIIEAKVVDEYGQTTPKRKITPVQWQEKFKQQFKTPLIDEIPEQPKNNLFLAGRIKQFLIFTTRDWLAKISNRQYLMINLLEAPILALLLAFIIRYNSAPNGKEYIFRYNENIPAFLLMAIIVALFMGLTVSAEEIIRDRKILKRESFLDLSWNSYLLSKLAILFFLSAVQTLAFIAIGNWILEIRDMTFAFALILFSTACFANVIGLTISSAFNSAVTVYILIPLLLIPQMVLSGLLFSFDKINELIGNKEKVPIVADLMASRWAYEAMAVYQFKNNAFEQPFFDFEKKASEADFKSAYLADELKKRNQFILDNQSAQSDSIQHRIRVNKKMIERALLHEPFRQGIDSLNLPAVFSAEGYSASVAQTLDRYFTNYKKNYQKEFIYYEDLIDKKMSFYEKNGFTITKEKNENYNESLADLVKNTNTENRIMEYEGRLIQLIDPVYQRPQPSHLLDYRMPFFASEKNLAGKTIDAYWFNILVIWLMSAIGYVLLYFKVLRRCVDYFAA
jgi:ABC transport system ATP-binding/permease protein